MIGIREFPALVVKPVGEPLPGFCAAVRGRQKSGDLVAKLFPRQVVQGDAQDSKGLRKQVGFHQIEKCRNQLAFRQVARRAEEDHHASPSGFASLLRFASRTCCFRSCHRIGFNRSPELYYEPVASIVGHRSSDS